MKSHQLIDINYQKMARDPQKQSHYEIITHANPITQAPEGEYPLKNQLALRMTFTFLFLTALISTMFNNKREEVITQDECLRDYSFIWTDKVNNYLAHNMDVNDRYIIFCSFLMDFMLLNFFFMWLNYWKSFRMVIAYILFFGARALIQRIFFITRLDGFLFHYPGFPSLTVAYHDSNDFFYSGHVGTCFIVVLEARAKRWYKLSWMCFFIMINQWIMMMFIRTHYFIDMVTGIIIAHYFHQMGERLSYYVDVKLLRQHLGKPDKRERYYYRPCVECGWSNDRAKNHLPKEEREIIKAMYYEQKGRSEEARSNQL